MSKHDPSEGASTLLTPSEQARVVRMISREIERTVLPALGSAYARSVALNMMTMLNTVALSADPPDTLADAPQGSSAANELQRTAAVDAALSSLSSAEAARLSELESPLTPERITAYLQTVREFSGDSVASVTQLPGGFSKQTFMVDTSAGQKLVIRRDLPRGPTPVSAADELPYLRALASHGLPVPRAIAAATGSGSLGHPFILMERVRGDCATDIANRSAQLGRRVCTGLAQVLAQLHSLSPASLGMSQPADPAACIAAYIQSWEELWLQRSQRHAPIVTSAFAWLHANVPQTIEHLALIHGDARPDNMLADDDGHVTALLDWEFIHVGDPAEDVLYACQFITPFIDIDTFMRAYRDAGGPNVDSNRAQFYEIWRNVRNLVCLDLSWSAFISGDYPAYVTGAPTLLFRRALIADLARSLQAVGL